MTIVVALSGGVDSAVAAFLLKKAGHEIIGVHMRNWDATVNEGEDVCSGKQDYLDAKNICETLSIPFYTYNFAPEYWEHVFMPYVDSLSLNMNANPDISCNSNIKFGVLLQKVVQDFGDSVKLATGHWAKVTQCEGRFYLDTCANKLKDQTYFLSSLTEGKLARVMFPLENIASKEEVRELAREMGLSIWDKRDSVGICFVGKRKYRDFIGKYIESKEGDLIDKSTGELLGKHQGTHLYVLHQRDGLFLKGYQEKYYVCDKDIEKNIVYLCRKSELPKYLYRTSSKCRNLHWIYEDLRVCESEYIQIKVRHSPNFLRVKILELNDDECVFEHESTHITTPGQAIVFYSLDKVRCLGMGIYVI